MDFLDNLRAQPVHVRKQIAFVTTATLSLLIASVWWSSWTSDNTAAVRTPALTVETQSPWSVVLDTLGHVKKGTLTAFHDVSNQLQYAAVGSIKNISSGSDGENTSEENTTSDSPVTSDTVASDTVGENVPGEQLHTRPKLLDTTTGNTAQ